MQGKTVKLETSKESSHRDGARERREVEEQKELPINSGKKWKMEWQ